MEKIKELLYEHCKIKDSDNIVIICQKQPDDCPDEYISKFEESREVCEMLLDACGEDGISAELASYTPTILRNGVEPPEDFKVEGDIILAPTAFSITHTTFVKTLKAKKIASMPGFKPYMFETIGNKEKLIELTLKHYNNLKQANKVHITGKDTDIVIELNPNLILRSTGFFDSKNIENIPGAEAYCVPKSANGYFTVPKGFGGQLPLNNPIKFIIKDGIFTDFEGDEETIRTKVKPFFEGKNFNVLAELGIGTNPNITKKYIQETGWSTLLAEKIFGSAHFANGNSKGMGGTNDVPIHIDWVVPDVKIEYY